MMCLQASSRSWRRAVAGGNDVALGKLQRVVVNLAIGTDKFVQPVVVVVGTKSTQAAAIEAGGLK